MSDIDVDVESAIGEDPEEEVNETPPPAAKKAAKEPKQSKAPKSRKASIGVAAPAAVPVAPPAPKPGVKQVGQNHPNAVVARQVRAAAPPVSMHPKNEQSRLALARWPLVLELLRDQALGPDAVTIRVNRMQLGQFAGATPGISAMPGHIEGAMVAGDDFNAPANLLAEAVTEMYHLASRARGPANTFSSFTTSAPRTGMAGRKSARAIWSSTIPM